MIRQFSDALRKKLREDMNAITDSVATRSCRSFDEYQYQCGVIQGLALAERALLDLAKLAEEDPDE